MTGWIKECTVVDGLTRTGLYAPDGSFNVVESDGSAWVGVYHPCGAYWVTQVSAIDETYAEDGSLNILDTVYALG